MHWFLFECKKAFVYGKIACLYCILFYFNLIADGTTICHCHSFTSIASKQFFLFQCILILGSPTSTLSEFLMRKSKMVKVASWVLTFPQLELSLKILFFNCSIWMIPQFPIKLQHRFHFVVRFDWERFLYLCGLEKKVPLLTELQIFFHFRCFKWLLFSFVSPLNSLNV